MLPDDIHVDYVAVVCQSEAACLAGHLEGLDILHSSHVRGWIADMAYAVPAFQPVQISLRKDILHQTGPFMQMTVAIIAFGGDSTALLTTVLEALQAKEREAGCLLHTVDSKDAAFFVDFFHGLIC